MPARAVLISNKYPFPADDGKKTVLAGFAAWLLERYGEDGFVYIVVGRKTGTTVESRSGRTLYVDPPTRFEQAAAAVGALLGRSSRSLQEALTWSRTTRRRLHAVVRELEPELLILDTIRVGQYFTESGEWPGCRRVLYMDDLFYLRFERLLDIASSLKDVELNPAGTFAAHLPSVARALLRSPFVQKPLFRLERKRVKRREIACPALFERCLLINRNEVHVLARETGASNIEAVKPVLPKEAAAPPRRYHGSADFLLFGSLRHPVYRASVLRFLDACMEDIVRRMPHARIHIVGAGADRTLRERVAKYPKHLQLAGFVDDPDELFAACRALLVPMLAPGGLKLKALTALYYGLPMVATGSGVDGIEVQNGHDCIVEDRIEAFPAHMQRLCDAAVNRAMSAHARQTYSGYYSRERVFAEYDKSFGRP